MGKEKGPSLQDGHKYISNWWKQNPNGTKEELQKAVVAWNRRSDTRPSMRNVISTDFALRLRPKAKEAVTATTTTGKPITIPPTIQESRDMFFNVGAYSDKEWFKDTSAPTADREKAVEEAQESGYMQKLRQAVKKEYGGEYIHEIEGDEQRQLAAHAMVDPKTGELLPMSSPAGQYTSDPTPTQDKKPVKYKKSSGFKMPGFGKRK